jgi:(p)ppGpp synthase/HD superfamily hydrolase
MPVAYQFAQTNLQLFSQMHTLGFSARDIALTNQSYVLATRLMTGQYRASRKTFIAHLVGTASILAWLRTSSVLVSAGLLHAIYESGDFGDGIHRGSHPSRKGVVQDAVGSEIERVVAQYATFSWNPHTIQMILNRVQDLEQWERDVVVIRLANELEEFLDFGLAYCGEHRRNQALYQEENFDVVIQLSHKLGYSELGHELATTFSATKNIQFPLQLRGSQPSEESFSIVPRSYQILKDAIARRLGSSHDRFNGPPSGS